MSSALGIPPARSTPAELLPYILQAVNQILMAPEELSYVKTMNVYTSVYNYVSSSSLDVGPDKEFNNMCTHLDVKFTESLAQHVDSILKSAEGLTDDELLQFYVKEWNRYSKAQKPLQRAYAYQERMKGLSSGMKRTITTPKLMQLLWRDHFVKRLVDAQETSLLSTAMMRHLTQADPVDEELLKKVALSFMTLGESDTDSIEIYKEYYEIPLRNIGDKIELNKFLFVETSPQSV